MAMRRGKWTLFVDIVGGCNLRCPSCPVGNSSDKTTPHGVMAPELLDRICAKAAREFSDPTIYLFNWAEPFLHPRLDEMIRVVKRHGLAVELSSNLNIARNLDKALAAEPRTLRVSVSGFEQDNYGSTHKRGDIERVKANMAELAALKKRTGAKTKLTVLFHRYLDNHGDEAMMKAYAEGLEFEFSAVWAYLMPAEKFVALGQGGLDDARLTAEDRDVIGRFALDPVEAIEIAKRHKEKPCRLLDRSLAITHTGDVLLCCATYDAKRFSVGNFLDASSEALQQRRERHDYCGECAQQGGHVYFNYDAPEFDDAAIARMRKRHPGLDASSLVVTKKKKKTPIHRLLRGARRLVGIGR
jgi:MoaA/NifB/PqqE/SkfB family radical SAM enzyme